MGDTWVDQDRVTVRLGQTVTFWTPNGARHRLRSDPHPAHTDCPVLNIPELGPGINGVTSPFLQPGTCRYHDDDFPKVRGEVVVLPIGLQN